MISSLLDTENREFYDVDIVVCSALSGANLFSKPTLDYCKWHLLEQNSMEFKSNRKNPLERYIWKVVSKISNV